MSTDTYKILAVDDNQINIKLLNRTLSTNHYQVLTAMSGEEALEKAQSDQPDLILLDVLMPGMDGYETCKQLSSIEGTKHIPIIFLSAKNETVDKARGFALGAVDYLTKPFNPIDIISRIRSHLKVREEVIALRHRNSILEDQLADLQSAQSETRDIPESVYFVDQMICPTIRESNKYFQLSSQVKFSQAPVTTLFLPVYLDTFNFTYINVGGFNKNHQTAIVELLLEKYVRGYLQGDSLKNFDDKFLARLFEQTLDQFSPDIYDTAFSISLGHIDAIKLELTLFSIHQNAPLIFNGEGQLYETEELPVFFESKFLRIIRARRYKLPANAILINYLKGKEKTEDTDLQKMFVPVLEKSARKDFLKCNEKLFDALDDNEQDQLIFSIRLL